MVRLNNCHRCRAEPFEASIYSLEVSGKALEIFKANFQAGLEVRLNFSRKDAVKVEPTINKGAFTLV